MRSIFGIVLIVLLALSAAAPSLAAGPKDPAQGDQKGIVASLIERALEKGEDPSVYVVNQQSAALSDDVIGPQNFQEHIVYAVLKHEPEGVSEKDPRLPVLGAVREYIEQNTPHEKQAELFAYQYCEEREIVDVKALADNEVFFDLVREMAVLFGIVTP